MCSHAIKKSVELQVYIYWYSRIKFVHQYCSYYSCVFVYLLIQFSFLITFMWNSHSTNS